jgi:hypothetical protein
MLRNFFLSKNVTIRVGEKKTNQKQYLQVMTLTNGSYPSRIKQKRKRPMTPIKH